MDVVRTLLTLSLWLAALGAAAAAVLAQGGRFSAKLDLLTHFAPIYFAAALAVLLLCGLAQRPGRAALAVVALVGVAASGALVAPEVALALSSKRAPAGTTPTLKVIQFNAFGNNASPERAVDWLAAQDADIIVLQEAPLIGRRLAARGYSCSCAARGVSIFSKAPALSAEAEPPRGGYPAYIGSATFEDARGAFTVVGVHRYWPSRPPRARAQAEALQDLLAGLPRSRLILAGDFNATPWAFTQRRDEQRFGLTRRTLALFSWPAARISHNRLPAPFPYLPIDHVYAGPGWATVSVERGPALGSDHYPVIVTLAPADSGGG